MKLIPQNSREHLLHLSHWAPRRYHPRCRLYCPRHCYPPSSHWNLLKYLDTCIDSCCTSTVSFISISIQIAISKNNKPTDQSIGAGVGVIEAEVEPIIGMCLIVSTVRCTVTSTARPKVWVRPYSISEDLGADSWLCRLMNQVVL